MDLVGKCFIATIHSTFNHLPSALYKINTFCTSHPNMPQIVRIKVVFVCLTKTLAHRLKISKAVWQSLEPLERKLLVFIRVC